MEQPKEVGTQKECVAKTISLEKAAELAGKNIWDVIDLWKKYQIPWGKYTEEGAELDDISITKLSKMQLEL